MLSAAASLATTEDVSPEYFRRQLGIHEELVHITIEINRTAPKTL